jgi:hypothetical protein
MTDFATLATGSPVIICGNPRSGTRMHANVLNAHPDVLITDEFHDIQKLRALLSDFRKNNLLKKFPRERALVRQSFLAKMIWLGYSIDRIAERGLTAKVIGNKTPQIERNYQLLENIFRSTPPKYVYCLRSAPKVLRSVKNLTNLRWNRDSVETNLGRYIMSVRCMEEMRAAFPERVCVSVIDHLQPGMKNSAFFARIFDFVGIELTDAVRDALDAMEAQNTMGAVKRATKQDEQTVELSTEELRLIIASPDYEEIRRRYELEPA